MIASAARFLPPQGPIDSFVALNPLQGFENLSFEEAVVRAGRLYRAQPFLSEAAYREALARERIRVADVEAVLSADLG
ncbi:MAG: putative inorganic carbon transporter subunit DabA, partial [bacterium]